MASRENQSMQIAVMLFFLISVLLAVMTYFFFKDASESRTKVKTLTDELNKQVATANSAQDEANAYKEMIGFSIEDNLDTIKTQYDKDMQDYAAGLPEGERYYKNLMKHYEDKIDKYEKAVQVAEASAQVAQDKLRTFEAPKQQQVETLTKKVAETAADINAIRAAYDKERVGLQGKFVDQSKQIADANAVIQDREAKLVQNQKAFDKKLKEQVAIIQEKDDRINAMNKNVDIKRPDGQITWVNQKSGIVWINLGEADYLKRQVTFTVFPVDENNTVLDTEKGAIEVTRILGRHQAEARILTANLTNPLLPGDKILSTVWTRGRQEGYVLAGFMDIDGDGESDRQTVRDLITVNGGRIDAELLDDGTIKGEVKISTSYLVVGAQPTDTSKKEMLANFSKLTGRARDLGISKINANRLVSELGWSPSEKTVNLNDSRNQSIGTEDATTNDKKSTPFRRRRPPASTF